MKLFSGIIVILATFSMAYAGVDPVAEISCAPSTIGKSARLAHKIFKMDEKEKSSILGDKKAFDKLVKKLVVCEGSKGGLLFDLPRFVIDSFHPVIFKNASSGNIKKWDKIEIDYLSLLSEFGAPIEKSSINLEEGKKDLQAACDIAIAGNKPAEVKKEWQKKNAACLAYHYIYNEKHFIGINEKGFTSSLPENQNKYPCTEGQTNPRGIFGPSPCFPGQALVTTAILQKALAEKNQ